MPAITINAKEYPLLQTRDSQGRVVDSGFKVASQSQLLEEAWESWEQMGETDRESGTGYFVTWGVDSTHRGALHLAPFYHNDNNPTDLTTGRGYFLEATGAAASIAHVDSAEGKASTVFTLTLEKVIAAGDNRILLAFLHLNTAIDNEDISITYDGVEMTKIVSSSHSLDPFVGIWYMVAPPVGTANIVVTLDMQISNSIIMAASDYTGVNQTDPFRNAVGLSGTGASMSLAIASATNDMCVDAAVANNDLSIAPVAGETERYNTDNTLIITDVMTGAGSEEAGAASVTMAHTWSGTGVGTATWRVVIASLKPATVRYVYVVDATKIIEYKYDSAAGLVDNSSQTIASGIGGRPAKFLGSDYVPMGNGAAAQRLDSSGAGTRWNSGGSPPTWKALHLAVYQKGGTPTLARANSATTNLIDLETAAPSGSGAFAGGHKIGDTSTEITDLVEALGQLFPAKEDNLYQMDQEGTAKPVLVSRTRGRADAENGKGMYAFHDIIFYPSNDGLDRYIVDEAAMPIGLDTIRTFREVPSVTSPKSWRHVGGVSAGQYQYHMVNSDTESLLIQMRFRDRNDPPGGEMVTNSILRIPLTLGMFVDSCMNLWLKGASVSEADRDIRVIELDEHGGLDKANRRGQASSDHDIYFDETSQGQSFDTKQFAKVVIETTNWDSNASLQVYHILDDGSEVALGSAITSSALTTIPWTVGTTDTGQRCRLKLRITTNSNYTPLTSDPQIISVLLVSRTPVIYEIKIDASPAGLEGYETDPKTTVIDLRKLVSGSLVDIEELGREGSVFSGEIVSSQEQLRSVDEDGIESYSVTLYARRWSIN